MPGCAKLGSLPLAQWLHQVMIDMRIEVNYILVAAMIDMYSKCGGIEVAKSIFERVQWDDVSIWNSMINGLAIHGFARDAIAVCSKMDFETGADRFRSLGRAGFLPVSSYWQQILAVVFVVRRMRAADRRRREGWRSKRGEEGRRG
ncbi:unnamed protein product [Linum tenue]|uniref:Pentatricopeptide repeat-containing protein n=1 Tax=Linum tenue TaxID=586396 RepID=A0AAV0IYA6_9ROSI|nr:unnamed protein product [Linum tenue]